MTKRLLFLDLTVKNDPEHWANVFGGRVLPTGSVRAIVHGPISQLPSYADGAWLTPAGYGRLFHGAHFAFKFHVAVVSLRPGADAARRLRGGSSRLAPPSDGRGLL